MTKKGFTLIELLAVIMILSIIVLVATISVSEILKESKQELSQAQIKSIKEAAKSWSSDNMDYLPVDNNCSFIMLKDLKDEGLLEDDMTDPKNNKNISDDLEIKITSKVGKNGKSVLDFEVDPKETKKCRYVGSNIYVDVLEGLTPVVYDEELEKWRTPKTTEEWYNYDKQKWANAVVLKNNVNKKPGDVITVEGNNPDALMMLVYIPRYEYKIEGQYGTHSNGTAGTQAQPGEIEVKFVGNIQTTADTGYIMHPAFTFGEQELNGIWVGKFELSSVGENLTDDNNLGCNQDECTSNISNLRILPNKESLRYNDVSNFFYAIRNIENTSLFGFSDVDTHMIKNSEWGAVAYLSQSKYGKYRNNIYSGIYREVYQNKTSSNLTGESNGIPSNTTIDPQCEYDDMTKLGSGKGLCGPGASTTGNIYGIYDMSGGAWEYVMGVLGDADGIYSGKNSSDNSGFKGKYGQGGENTTGADLPDEKYYDKYTTDNALTACNSGICYGHALSETNGWYGDIAFMIDLANPWFSRGDYYLANSLASGIFGFSSLDGSKIYGTRVVFVSK